MTFEEREVMNLALAGVGGQGSVLAGRIIARAADLVGYDVATSEVHGMSQRGGSVFTTVRYGTRVLSPMVPEGEADALIAFEKLEALRYLDYLEPGGLALVNDQKIAPTLESLKLAPYPHNVEETLRQRAGAALLVPGLDIAVKLGNPKLANTVILGALSTYLDMAEEAWRRALMELVPPKTVELNEFAFEEGAAWAREHSSILAE